MKNKFKFKKPEIRLSKRKKILLIVMAAIILIGAGGYFGYMKYLEHGYTVMLEGALKAKYKKSFTAKKVDASKEEGITAYLLEDGTEDRYIKAWIDVTGTGLKDDYAAALQRRRITKNLTETLKPDSYMFIHTDNRLEYVDDLSKDPAKQSSSDYLTAHPKDAFDVTVLINKEEADPAELRNLLGSRAYTLTVERGDFRVYALDADAYDAVVKETRRYDSMKRDEIRTTLEKEGDRILLLDFEEINPKKEEETKKEAAPKKEEAKAEPKEEGPSNVTDTDKQ